MPAKKDYFVDDFLEGSYLYYNKVPMVRKPYVFYPRLYGFERLGPKYYNEMEFWKEFTVILTTKGTGEFTIKGVKYILREGDLIFVENHSYHSLKSIPGEDWNIHFVHLYPSPMLEEIYQTIHSRFGPVIHDIPADWIVPYTEKLCAIHLAKSENAASEMSETIYAMLLGLLDGISSRKEATTNPSVVKMMNFIEEHYTEEVYVTDLAKLCNYSKNHVEWLFKAETGMTLKEYINKRRIHLAKELIASTNDSFDDIAIKCGFREYRSLYYAFTKATGTTPGKYRKKKQKGN